EVALRHEEEPQRHEHREERQERGAHDGAQRAAAHAPGERQRGGRPQGPSEAPVRDGADPHEERAHGEQAGEPPARAGRLAREPRLLVGDLRLRVDLHVEHARLLDHGRAREGPALEGDARRHAGPPRRTPPLSTVAGPESPCNASSATPSCLTWSPRTWPSWSTSRRASPATSSLVTSWRTSTPPGRRP